MSAVVLAILGSGLLGGASVGAFFKFLIERKVTDVRVQSGAADLAEQIGESASSWIQRQDAKVQALERELADARAETAKVRADSEREVQQLRVELGKLSQELNAFRLGISAPLGYVIIPRIIWEQARRRDVGRGELPTTAFPGEDIEAVLRDIKDPGEGGGV